jgi:hypothetical protein
MYKNNDTVKHTLEDGVYTELGKGGKKLFVLNLRHSKTVDVKFGSGDSVTEYDKWGRTVFHLDDNQYWVLKYYNEPTEPNKVQQLPYHVVHKYWELYNGLNTL